mmetsp:Transcript_23554/g.68896  ORF Transcript_23554/g.68896 Transcript_23554/m.68896 type:complete len:244 (+) Transcript_23554:3-734(+)
MEGLLLLFNLNFNLRTRARAHARTHNYNHKNERRETRANERGTGTTTIKTRHHANWNILAHTKSTQGPCSCPCRLPPRAKCTVDSRQHRKKSWNSRRAAMWGVAPPYAPPLPHYSTALRRATSAQCPRPSCSPTATRRGLTAVVMAVSRISLVLLRGNEHRRSNNNDETSDTDDFKDNLVAHRGIKLLPDSIEVERYDVNAPETFRVPQVLIFQPEKTPNRAPDHLEEHGDRCQPVDHGLPKR